MLLTDEDPCDGCSEKVDDVFGRFCDIACGKHSIYIIKQSAYKAQLKKVVEWLLEPCIEHARITDTGSVLYNKLPRWCCSECFATLIEEVDGQSLLREIQ